MPKLVFQDSDGIDRTVELGAEPLLIGRAAECQVQTQDALVSRRHARIFWDGGYWIEDLGSANGVYVGGERVQRAPLRPGDEVRCGSLVMRVVPEVARSGPGLRPLVSQVDSQASGPAATPAPAIDVPTGPRRRISVGPEPASPELQEERSRRIQAEAAVLTAEQRASTAEGKLREVQASLDDTERRIAALQADAQREQERRVEREAERWRKRETELRASLPRGGAPQSSSHLDEEVTNADAGAVRDRAVLQRKVEQLSAEVRRLRGAGPPSVGPIEMVAIEDERVSDLEARLAIAVQERDEAREQLAVAQAAPAPAGNADEAEQLKRMIDQLAAENRRLRQGMAGGERTPGTGEHLVDAASTVDDTLADLRGHLRAAHEEVGALAATAPGSPGSLSVLGEALTAAGEQLETARRRLRELQRLLRPT